MPRFHLSWATSLMLLAAAPAAYAQYTTTNPQTVADTGRLFDEPFRPLTRGWMMCAATEGVRLIEVGQTDLAAAQPARLACSREWANLRGVVGKAIGLPRADRALGQLFESFKLKLRGDYLASRVAAIDADGPLTLGAWAMYPIRRGICYVRTRSSGSRYEYKLGRADGDPTLLITGHSRNSVTQGETSATLDIISPDATMSRQVDISWKPVGSDIQWQIPLGDDQLTALTRATSIALRSGDTVNRFPFPDLPMSARDFISNCPAPLPRH